MLSRSIIETSSAQPLQSIRHGIPHKPGARHRRHAAKASSVCQANSKLNSNAFIRPSRSRPLSSAVNKALQLLQSSLIKHKALLITRRHPLQITKLPSQNIGKPKRFYRETLIYRYTYKQSDLNFKQNQKLNTNALL